MVINFGLWNTLATFQQLMNKLLQSIKACYGKDIQRYIDNILIATKDDLEYYKEVIKIVLDAIKKKSLFLKPEKCEFEKCHIKYLRILLKRGIIQPDPSKVMGLQDWPTTLKSIKEVWSILEVLEY